jgi:hypothetical protein
MPMSSGALSVLICKSWTWRAINLNWREMFGSKRVSASSIHKSTAVLLAGALATLDGDTAIGCTANAVEFSSQILQWICTKEN